MMHPLARRILLALGATGMVACSSSSTTDSDAGPIVDSAKDSVVVDTAIDAGPDDTADTADASVPDVPCVRRPFLVGAEPRAGEIALRDDWANTIEASPLDEALDEGTRRALAAAWLEDGRQEHASIAAFARFTMLAIAVGAPPELVIGSQRAGLDEVRHARGCFALARRYGEIARGPGALRLEGALAEPSLAGVAALTVHEGCVGETLGVMFATEQRDGAKDPFVRRFLDALVHDEQRHAELAWSFVRWALSIGGEEVRVAVERAFDEAIAASLALEGRDVPVASIEGMRAHGRLAGRDTKPLVRRGLREIVEPCRAQLLASAKPTADGYGASQRFL